MTIPELRKTLSFGLAAAGFVVVLSLAGAAYLRWKSNDTAMHPVAVETTETPEELLHLAGQLLEEQQAEQAIVAFREILARHPDSGAAQAGIAQGEFLAGREEDAAREYERLREMDPENAGARLELAVLYSHHKETWALSSERYREYLQMQPDDASAQLGLARVLAWTGDSEGAAALFARPEVSRLKGPADERHHAFALTKLKRLDDAEPILRRVLERDANDVEAVEQLAAVYASRRQWDAALPLYRRVLAARPNDASLKLVYGQGLLAQRRYAEALGPLGHAAATMPNHGEAGLAYARAWKGAGELKKASREFERVLPRFARDGRVQREYGDLLLERKKYRDAARQYAEAERLGVRDDRLNAAMGGALSANRKHKEAVPYLERAYRASPTPRRAMDLAKAYSKTGRREEARALLEKVERSVTQTAQR